jgi:predicted AlkP superfamily pyrophosphatase or phosphodiesterase
MILLIVVIFSAASLADEAPQGIVLIGWDGAQREHVKDMLAANELPNLAALAKNGKMVDIDIVSGDTETTPGWAQILTGYAPDKTGVYSNKIYRPIPDGFTIFERLEKFLGPTNIDTEAIIAKKGHLDFEGPKKIPIVNWLKKQKNPEKIDITNLKPSELEGSKIVKEDGAIYLQTPGEPYFNAKDKLDLFKNNLGANEKVGAVVLDRLEKCQDKRFFMFVHFLQPDKAGHKFGENSQEYADAMQLDDLWTGIIIAKLKELNIYGKTLVYVVVDHGFDEGKKAHSYAPYVFLTTNDKKINRNGTREDIAPTILKRFGMDVSKIEPRLDGIPLDEPAPNRKAPAEKPKTSGQTIQ